MEKLEHTVFQISELIGKERFGTLSEEENEVLEEWRRQSAEHETLYQKLQDTRYLSESVARLSGIDTRQPLQHMQRQIAGFTRRNVQVRLALGSLAIRWAEDGNIYMAGPAAYSFTGSIA